MSGNVQITGAPTTPGPDGSSALTNSRRTPVTHSHLIGSIPIRREIRDLQTNSPDQFNLFLLGLREFQGVDENQLLSYYQIAGKSHKNHPGETLLIGGTAGIHGEPFKAWDNVQGIDDWNFGGYCTHSSVLFVPWHRPYLALFEVTMALP